MAQRNTTKEAAEVLVASPVEPPFEDLVDVSRNLQTIAHAVLDPLCKKYGLNKMALFALVNLEKFPDQTPSNLSIDLHAKRTNVASTLRNLEYKDLIGIGVSSQDKRHRLVNLTEKGHAVACAIVADLEDARAALVNGVDEERIAMLKEAWGAFSATVAEIAADLEERVPTP